MKRILTLAAFLTPLALCALPSYAVPQNALPLAGVNADAGLMIPVQHGRCGFWWRECTLRWPARGPRFYRCLRIHGC